MVTCKITHELGHSEETSLSAPADSSGSKNAIQAIGSTITYLQRYTLLALTGLATHEQDDDAQAVSEKIDDKQLHSLRDALIAVGMEDKEGALCKHFNLESLEDLPKADYQKAVSLIQAAAQKKEKK